MLSSYIPKGVVSCDEEVDGTIIRGRTAIVTGGSSGIGEAYCCALIKAGAFVVIADRDEVTGTELKEKLGPSAKFVNCDVSKWSDQFAAFKEAISLSPSGTVDIVIANAGISGTDPVFGGPDETTEPVEPPLKIIEVDLVGVLHTVNLALHYFRQQHARSHDHDLAQILILQGSMAGYLGLPGAVQYAAAKYGLRGIMKSLRSTEWRHNIRVGYIAPWFTATRGLSEAARVHLTNLGIEFATVEDAAELAVKIIVDPKTNGRAFATLPRSMAARGYADLNQDDYEEGTLLDKLQCIADTANHRQIVK